MVSSGILTLISESPRAGATLIQTPLNTIFIKNIKNHCTKTVLIMC